MIETGRVHKIDSSNRATVRFPRKTACENCRMCLKPRNEMFAQIVLKNTLNAKVGDYVSIEMGERAVLSASLLVYALPLAFLALALFLTKRLSEEVSFLISIGVLVLGFVVVAIIDKFIIRKNKAFVPVMRQIISLEEGNNENTDTKQEDDIQCQ